MDHRTPTPDNPWLALRNLTPARIALGRTGTSLPTGAQLDFQFAHAVFFYSGIAHDAALLGLGAAWCRE